MRRAWLELVGLGCLLAFAVAGRVVAIGAETDIADEGIRGLQLRMVAAGFRPVAEVYSHEGPLTITILFPLYLLFGQDLVAARLAVGAYAVATILAVAWLGRRLAGPVAGLAAGGILALSPVYLEFSRQALVEVAALAPAVLGVGLLVEYRLSGRRRWLVASAVLLGIGALAKWMTLLVGAAALALLVAPSRRSASGLPFPPSPLRRRLADLLLYGAASIGTITAVVLLSGPSEVVEQLVGYRAGARTVREWSPAENLGTIGAALGREGLGLVAAALAGAAVLLRSAPPAALGLLAWVAGAAAVMLLYTPLWPKHLVYGLPPLALLAGVAFAVAAEAGRAIMARRRPALLGVAALAAAGLHLAGLPAVAEQQRGVLGRQSTGDVERFADDLRIIRAATGPADYIVMDDAYLAELSGRLTPPHLVDLSYTRIRARVLSSQRLKEDTERFGALVVSVQDDHLGQLPRYVEWLDRTYVLARSYVRRSPKRYRRVYVHPAADLAAARAAVAAHIDAPLRAELGPVALLGYELDRPQVGRAGTFDLTLHWEALADRPPEHELVLRLRAADGRAVQEEAWPIGDDAQDLSAWRTGQWQIQTMTVQVSGRVQRGAYDLTLGVRGGDERPVPIRNHVGGEVTGDGAELKLATLVVR